MVAVPQRVDMAVGQGWSLIPCRADKRPYFSWKEFQSRKPTPKEIECWQSELNPPAWAVVTGGISGVCVIDFDGAAGRQTCESLNLRPHVRTGNGGYHLYVKAPSWATPTVNGKSKQQLGKQFPGLDFRGTGGYAVFDGKNESGAYGWLRPMQPDPLDSVPENLRAALGLLHPPEETVPQKPAAANGRPTPSNPSEPRRVSTERLVSRALESSGTGRNDAGFWLASQLRDNGYGQSEAEAVLLDYQRRVPPANTKGQPEPYTRDEALASVQEAYKRTPREPWTAPRARPAPARSGVPAATRRRPADNSSSGPPIDPTDFSRTDLGNSEYLAARCADRLRYCPPWKRWLTWDGTRWAIDNSGAVYREAGNAVRALYRAAEKIEDPARRQAIATWAVRCESRARLEAMVSLSQSQSALVIQPDQLDTDPWVLNLENGTVDLRTGSLRPHRRNDLITKVCPVQFDSSARAATFQKFLGRIMQDKRDLVHYLQRWAGYCLTGSVKEQTLNIWHGTGANGKSTLQNCLLEMLGDYAVTTPSETLMARANQSSIPNDIARLKGVRFTAAFETGTNSRLNEGMVKQATGGDRLSARFLHCEFFEFTPEFKIVLSSNHKPRIVGTDHGIWRRVNMIPFDVTIPEPERDKDLPDKLRDELPGVFNWALAGCLEWQRTGLDPPREVRAATADYRGEQDVLGVFIAERCELNGNSSASASAIYGSYKNWAEATGERPISRRMLGVLLKERGLESRRSGLNGSYEWHGVAVREVQLVQ